jgi:hypothetical protein
MFTELAVMHDDAPWEMQQWLLHYSVIMPYHACNLVQGLHWRTSCWKQQRLHSIC